MKKPEHENVEVNLTLVEEEDFGQCVEIKINKNIEANQAFTIPVSYLKKLLNGKGA